ncbi:MAG: 50S ribosomal protein L24 [Candidatus Omnitrophica bacterium]|nr:50S ribosomal protein L24 [Candidatus Omnitrophota bacterium]
MLKIKKNDQVYIIAGKDKGKSGKILKVFPSVQRAIVENINIVKKTRRKSQKDPSGGFVDIEAPIHVSNIMLIDKKTNKPTRFSVSMGKNNKKVRISKKSGEVI